MCSFKNRTKHFFRRLCRFLTGYDGIQTQRIEEKLQLLDDRMKQLLMRNNPRACGKIRVVFLVQAVEFWYSLISVAERMKEDNAFEPIIVSIPGHLVEGDKLRNISSEYFLKSDFPCIIVDESNLFENIIFAINPDVVFRQQPYDEGVPKAFGVEKILGYRICYVPYGIASNPVGEVIYNQIVNHYAWRLYCIDEYHKECYKKYNRTSDINTVITGFTKFEYMTKFISSSSLQDWPIKKTNRKKIKILWCPHHTFDDLLNFATFHETCYPIYELALSNPDIEIVMRPHPALFGKLVKNEKMTQLQIDEYTEQFSSLPNCFIDYGAEYLYLFKEADLLLTDGVGFLFEFLITDKPIIFIDNCRNVGFDEYHQQFMAAWYVVHDVVGVKNIIDSLREGHDELREIRKKMKSIICPACVNSPSEIIVEDIKKAILG